MSQTLDLRELGRHISGQEQLQSSEAHNTNIIEAAERIMPEQVDAGVYFENEHGGRVIVLRLTSQEAAIAFCVGESFEPSLITLSGAGERPHTIMLNEAGDFVKERDETERIAIEFLFDALSEAEAGVGEAARLSYDEYLRLGELTYAARFTKRRAV